MLGKRSFSAAPFLLLCVVLLAALLVSVIAATDAELRCSWLLTREDIPVACRVRGGVLYLESDDLFAVRDALCVLRRADRLPDAVCWRAGDGEWQPLTRTNFLPAATARRETLSAEMTELKVKYELQQARLTADVRVTVTDGGKYLRVTVESSPAELSEAAAPLRAVIETVNADGGGIVRWDAAFAENGAVFAALSADLICGDVLTTESLRFLIEES